MENKSKLWVWFAIAGAALVGWYLYEKKQVETGAKAASDISNPIARGLRWVAGGSSSVVSKVPVIGPTAASAFYKPVTNITSGNWKDTGWSIVTGGLSDIF